MAPPSDIRALHDETATLMAVLLLTRPALSIDK